MVRAQTACRRYQGCPSDVDFSRAEGALSLAGKVAVVTGGNGGLGRAMADALQQAGATVAVTGRSVEKNAAVEAEFEGRIAVYELDVRDESRVEAVLREVNENFGSLDVLVNNAGLFRGGPASTLERSRWDAVIETHLTGSFLCARHASRLMRAAGRGGKIINIGSMYSLFGPPDFADYAAAKTGLLGLTRALAVELAPVNIQVNAILPGWYETGLTSGLPHSELGEQIRRKTPARRWGLPEDLAGAAIFLASSASDFITGVALPVDGGYSISDRLLST